MSGVVFVLAEKYVGKCGPMCCIIPVCMSLCISLPWVFEFLYPRHVWFALRSAIR